jgi:hypothetical protein
MTRRSKREIERALEDLYGEDPMNLGPNEMLEWIRHLTRTDDVKRPPDYFADDAEWVEELESGVENAIERDPALEPLTPPEIHVLSYMPDKQRAPLLDLYERQLEGDDPDESVVAFVESVVELEGGA